MAPNYIKQIDMKKTYIPVITLLFFFIIAGLLSCKKNFLNATETNSLTPETVFADSSNTVHFLGNIYVNILVSENANRFGNGGLDAAGDEGQPGNLTPSQANYWAQGTINAAIVSDDVYTTCYTQIRAVNLLLANLKKTKLSLPDAQPGSRAQMRAEARFLRAWYYALLVKHYGGVPLVGDRLYTYTDEIDDTRSTFADCIRYITSECDSAAKVLPYIQTQTSYGRASGSACQALKARVLLMAASPLFSVTGNIAVSLGRSDLAPLVGYVGADSTQQRWVMAKNAAYLLIKSGQFGLFVDSTNKNRPGLGFQALFGNRITPVKNFANSNEYILQTMLAPDDYGHQLEAYWDTPSNGGANGAFPYQEMVDAFPMRDGKDTLTSAFKYNGQHPYWNRDPRLGYTIQHDSTVMSIRLSQGARGPISIYLIKDPVTGEISSPGPDAILRGASAGSGTTTGYYVNKMLDTASDATDLFAQTHRCQPLIRYAEVLLNYAEAYNESKGTDSAYSVLVGIRQRAGILPGTDHLFGLQPGMSQAQMRAAIQHERQIELAYEGFRFWDVRRWKIAPVTENKLFHGMQVTRPRADLKAPGTFTIFPASQHFFTDRMYFWPIPQNEIGKSKNNNLKQNPGY